MIALEPTTSPCKVPIEVELFGRKNKKIKKYKNKKTLKTLGIRIIYSCICICIYIFLEQNKKI